MLIERIAVFALVVGIGATVVLDLWALALRHALGVAGANWGIVGRWLMGLGSGNVIYRGTDLSAPTRAEKALGWAFHYLVGLGYAALYPLVWGAGFLNAPRVLPVVLVGFVFSTLAGLVVLTPCLGGGVFARKAPDQPRRIALSLVNHTVFAVAQFALARALAA
ncbi:DUF2938 domain-containing protein [Novosphingobium sp. 1949]|uniref:DUF2938 domain-containing protein n=1 Tax=Novosphingobium organovorum TaxID=2930092 RepID=A0ABT0B8Y1_9SPHN|nr:DUF2938 family protein [Novosphingobium organovorum]MCJ2181306.1 DUF2938 domain-containing protein [Novosphingobium organovorum]